MAQTLTPPRPTLEDPEPEPPAPAPERRRVGARRAFVTLLVCLGAWALLFAPVLERSAETSPVGARRTAALAVLRPLAALSDALAADRVTDLVQRALGRDPEAAPGGELEIPDFELPPLVPSEGGPIRGQGLGPATPSPAPDARGDDEPKSDRNDQAEERDVPAGIRVPTEDAKLRVAVVGDSLSQGLGPAVVELFDPVVSRVVPLGRQSTGLARQDYFNWQFGMRKLEEEFRPDLVFVLLGSNDNQAQITREGDAVPIGSVAWVQAYRERAAAFLREATSNGTRVVWVGVPVVRDRQRWDFYRRVNDVYRATAEADPLATYVDAWGLFQGRDGQYSAYLRNERGVVQVMRAPDGLHLTPAGYGYLARVAVRAAAEAFGLPQRAVTIRI